MGLTKVIIDRGFCEKKKTNDNNNNKKDNCQKPGVSCNSHDMGLPVWKSGKYMQKGSTCFPQKSPLWISVWLLALCCCVWLMAVCSRKSSYATREYGDDWIRTGWLWRKAQGKSWFPQLVSHLFLLPNQKPLRCKEAAWPLPVMTDDFNINLKEAADQMTGGWSFSLKVPPSVWRWELVYVTRFIMRLVPQVESYFVSQTYFFLKYIERTNFG